MANHQIARRNLGEPDYDCAMERIAVEMAEYILDENRTSPIGESFYLPSDIEPPLQQVNNPEYRSVVNPLTVPGVRDFYPSWSKNHVVSQTHPFPPPNMLPGFINFVPVPMIAGTVIVRAMLPPLIRLPTPPGALPPQVIHAGRGISNVNNYIFTTFQGNPPVHLPNPMPMNFWHHYEGFPPQPRLQVTPGSNCTYTASPNGYNQHFENAQLRPPTPIINHNFNNRRHSAEYSMSSHSSYSYSGDGSNETVSTDFKIRMSCHICGQTDHPFSHCPFNQPVRNLR